MAKRNTKNKGGRPERDFKRELAKKYGSIVKSEKAILGHFERGLKVAEVFATIENETGVYIPSSTYYQQKDKDANNWFAELIEKGRQKSLLWWGNKGRDHIVGNKEEGTLNAGVYNKEVANMFPEIYKDDSNKLEIENADSKFTITINGDNYE